MAPTMEERRQEIQAKFASAVEDIMLKNDGPMEMKLESPPLERVEIPHEKPEDVAVPYKRKEEVITEV